MGTKGFTSSYSLQPVIQGSQCRDLRQELMWKSWRNAACWLGLQGLLSPLTEDAKTTSPGVVMHSEQGLPHQPSRVLQASLSTVSGWHEITLPSGPYLPPYLRQDLFTVRHCTVYSRLTDLWASASFPASTSHPVIALRLCLGLCAFRRLEPRPSHLCGKHFIHWPMFAALILPLRGFFF